MINPSKAITLFPYTTMAQQRYFYGASISDFVHSLSSEVYGQISMQSPYSDNPETKASWLSEIEVLQDALKSYDGRGSIFMEYNIPRMGRRADVIILIDGLVFVLEFKTAGSSFSHQALTQVWDYAIDLKNFQLKTLERTLLPIVVVPSEKNKNCNLTLVFAEDDVYMPTQVNSEQLPVLIDKFLNTAKPYIGSVTDFEWAKGGYEPTPTIIEAAVALYSGHTVEDITKHDGDLDATNLQIEKIISHCKRNRQKAICFVTGVPGAGKTLIGLQTAIKQFNNDDKAVYLSGNFPLVEVLQEALARDFVKRGKLEFELTGDRSKKVTKEEARSKVKAFIQMIHHYRDLYLEGTQVCGDRMIPIEGYFESHTDRAYVPADHVAIFDEAQRAWTKEELARFMKEKKGIKQFPFSEPAYLISCMDRHQDWGVVICLIGGGQEINKGEAGMLEWIRSINEHFTHWHVYLSSAINGREYSETPIIEKLTITKNQIHIVDDLHLNVSMRSFRAEKVSEFVHYLLELDKEQATSTLKELTNYPIVLTRDLDRAKDWLRSKSRGSERCGLLASSKAERLKAININVRYQPNFVHWFLENDGDIRSSNALEDTLTEFKVQGLEIDWACVAWDADLRLNKQQNKWSHHQLRSGTTWQNINKRENQAYQINAYRVLLTRARQGMIIVVPNGDHGVPPDETRKPEWYDGIFSYLKEIGIPEL